MRPIFDCPLESFPTGIYECKNGVKMRAYKFSWVKDRKMEVCDIKLWFTRPGKGWYTENKQIRHLINREYNGILNTQNKQHIVVGNKLYGYRLTPQKVLNELYLVY